MMNGSFNAFNSLSRSHTPNSLNSASRASPSPKCFGKNTHLAKEDYEREKGRWQQKLEEAELKLNEASINNSELFQIKAELNRKVLDLEKNQRPMIEQNRRLNQRIRSLNAETKKVEEKLRDAQEDYFNMRDAYDRLAKENCVLKEQRAFPEKVEELSRYRNQVLEYSKCITALRQSMLEKDQRYELLVLKLKKFRLKCLAAKRNAGFTGGGTGDDEDKQSCIGSEGSMEDSISVGLDTIAEDLDEDMSELLRTPMTPTEYSLKQQLDLANGTILELQSAIELATVDVSNKLSETVQRQHGEIAELRGERRRLEIELANIKESNDLLEFQLMELTEGSQRRHVDFCDKNCFTDLELPYEDGITKMSQIELMTIENPSEELVSQIRSCSHDLMGRIQSRPELVAGSLHQLLCKSPSMLSNVESQFLKGGVEVIDGMQKQLFLQSTELNMAKCELDRIKREFEDEVREAKNRLEEEMGSKKAATKKKELLAEIEQLRREKKEETRRTAKQLQDSQNMLNDRSKEIQERSDHIRQLNGELRVAKSDVETHMLKAKVDEEMITELKRRVNQHTVDLASAVADVEAYKEKLRDAEERHGEEKSRLQDELKSTKTELASHASRVEDLRSEMINANKNAEGKVSILEVELANAKKALESAEASFAVQRQAADKEALRKLEEQQTHSQAEIDNLEREQSRLRKEIADRNAEITTLSEQLRVVDQADRRYDDSRYRLADSLKKSYELEEELRISRGRIATLEEEVPRHMLKIQQLQAYNHELEEQFNSQMDIISALRKKFADMKRNVVSTDSIGWTSNSSDGANSLEEDPHYPDGYARVQKSKR